MSGYFAAIRIKAIVQMATTFGIEVGQRFSGNVHLDLGISAANKSVHQGIGT